MMCVEVGVCLMISFILALALFVLFFITRTINIVDIDKEFTKIIIIKISKVIENDNDLLKRI